YYLYFEKIMQLIHELDALFPPDEVIARYFTPLKTKETPPSINRVSLGSMLLSIPAELTEPFSIDSLIELYSSWPTERLLEHFYKDELFFYTDKNEFTPWISGFISACDDLFAESEEKWAVIDAAANPVPHLKKLAPFVRTVAEHIEKCTAEFKPLFESIKKDLEESAAGEDILKTKFAFELSHDEMERAECYQNLIGCDIVGMVAPSGLDIPGKESPDVRRHIVTIGIFTPSMLRYRMKNRNARECLNLLKMVSDPTRFNILYDMCDNYVYGRELAEKYGTTGRAMYYHLEKLMGIGLITLKTTDYRMLYTLNKRYVYDSFNAVRDYLLRDWKPLEDGDGEE
ncbi:MAG: winged helix-turn-helix transcriptional regulator, partial [Clostridia bacterium]|nr:winged helix-turn-helix transcriptional regulator [Clostridia bacterium]